jgi:hypothetical protein
MEHSVNKGGFAMINVSNYGNVSDILHVRICYFEFEKWCKIRSLIFSSLTKSINFAHYHIATVLADAFP